MTTAYDELCSAVLEHDSREATFRRECTALAQAFRDAFGPLGFPQESLQWVPWGDRGIADPGTTLSLALTVLQDEGCDGATLRVRIRHYYCWPELRLRSESSGFTLVVGGREFTGPAAEAVGAEAARHLVGVLQESLVEMPAAWLRDHHPRPQKKPLGFEVVGPARST